MQINFLKYFMNQANQEELDTLESWQKENKANLIKLEQMRAIHEASEGLKGYQVFDKAAAYQKITGQSLYSTKANPLTKVIYAAAAILVLGLATIFLFKNQLTTPLQPTLYTATESNNNFILNDGTDITLDQYSQLKVDADRIVSLNGRALFHVTKKDNKANFVVKTAKGNITVLGTIFSVRQDSLTTEIFVYEGHVVYTYDNRSVDLYKGELAKLVGNDIVKTSRHDTEQPSWISKNLVFNNTHLVDVIAAFNQHYKANIILKEGIIPNEQCRVTTKFKNESLDKALKEISSLLNISYHTEGTNIVITSIKC